eukprot:jgi/Ulvmu1/3486/UM161_0003.1
MNDTLRENVLLGLPMDEERYQAALTAAQLAADLEQLHDGDLTEIGEQGVTLSGGQKQRISIARGVYSDADAIILDDPLSAVDSHVGRSLFQDCICSALRGKTVLLVTNALHFLHATDQVRVHCVRMHDAAASPGPDGSCCGHSLREVIQVATTGGVRVTVLIMRRVSAGYSKQELCVALQSTLSSRTRAIVLILACSMHSLARLLTNDLCRYRRNISEYLNDVPALI